MASRESRETDRDERDYDSERGRRNRRKVMIRQKSLAEDLTYELERIHERLDDLEGDGDDEDGEPETEWLDADSKKALAENIIKPLGLQIAAAIQKGEGLDGLTGLLSSVVTKVKGILAKEE
jgi:hypothetical protein